MAQDPVKVDPTHYKVLIDNASVRVLKIDYAPGTKSQMHQHPEGIIIPLNASKVRFTMPDGKSEDQEMAAESAMMVAAVTHSPANIGSDRIDGILVEFKAISW
jgi:predicted metal-dependent enzyme (double-stranded beta helix superfamily)